MINNSTSFYVAKRVRTIRRVRGLTQKQLVGLAGVSRYAIRNLENGRTWTAETLDAVLVALDAVIIIEDALTVAEHDAG